MLDTIIIGGGAAGLMSAIHSIDNNKNILLIEKMSQCGRKLRITGKGRCNLTNMLEMDDFLKSCGPNPEFLRPSFQAFFNQDLVSLMNSLGVPLKEERGRRVFPKSNKSLDVFLAMINKIENSPNARILKNSIVTEILKKDNRAIGVRLGNNKEYYADKIILATGGKSYPLTGSNGEGYALSKNLGHSIVRPIPGLVGFELDHRIPRRLIDFPLRNVEARILDKDGNVLAKDFGEMTFGKASAYGPIIISLNRRVSRDLYNGEKLRLSLDLKPSLSCQKLENKIKREIDIRGDEPIESFLRTMMPRQLIELFVRTTKLYGSSYDLDREDKDLIIKSIKNLEFDIKGDLGFREAIVTLGGIDTREINPHTLESKLIKGLFFAGEVMDVDADTGGYNLQIAFSTGVLASK